MKIITRVIIIVGPVGVSNNIDEYSPKTIEKIPIKEVISSEWCRCKETASIAFSEYKTEKFLNSFFVS